MKSLNLFRAATLTTLSILALGSQALAKTTVCLATAAGGVESPFAVGAPMQKSDHGTQSIFEFQTKGGMILKAKTANSGSLRGTMLYILDSKNNNELVSSALGVIAEQSEVGLSLSYHVPGASYVIACELVEKTE